MKIGIAGNGWVGKSMLELFPDAVVYDKPQALGSMWDLNKCDVVFICVPTPLTPTGFLDTSIVEEIVRECDAPLLVIRSTVNPGDTDRMVLDTGKCIVFEPEYLGETPAHPLLHPNGRQFKIIGGLPKNRRQLIDLYTTVYNANITLKQVSTKEAEIIKLSENRAIGFKVMQCHELYLACEAAGVDYYTIRDAVYGDDPRFNLWFTMIYPTLGFDSSKCLVKDIPAWAAWAETVGADASLTNELIKRSTEYGKRNRSK